METFDVTYRIDAPASDVDARAEAVLLEQTVETPAAVAQAYPFVRDHMMGRIQEITPHPGGGFRVVLALPLPTAIADAAQFVNVLFGNASLHADVVLEDFTLPAAVARLLVGPRHGLAALRIATGVAERPLTCSALKPVGLTVDEVARLCRRLAEGGIDIIKDDHYLADHPFCPFDARVRACQAAVDEVAARTGHRTLYAPNLSGPPDAVRRQAETAQALGVRVVMAAPMLLGLPTFHALVRDALDVPILAHPAFAGALRIRPAALLGKLFRLYGADAVIFASFGGRFSLSPAACGDLADALRAPWDGMRAALPAPAGGMTVERVSELVAFYGNDVMLLVGGSLLLAGEAVSERTRAFTEAVAGAARS